jgi:hypothetical protein
MGHLAHNDPISVPTGSITVEDFTQSRIHKEIAASPRVPSLEQLEALAEALLDFQGPDDLAAWFAAVS